MCTYLFLNYPVKHFTDGLTLESLHFVLNSEILSLFHWGIWQLVLFEWLLSKFGPNDKPAPNINSEHNMKIWNFIWFYSQPIKIKASMLLYSDLLSKEDLTILVKQSLT